PRLHAVAALALALAIAAGCRPKPPEAPPAPVPPGPEIASTASIPPVMGEVAVDAPSAAAPMSVPVPRPGPARQEPPRLEDMQLASSSSKLGVPVDLRYQFDAPVEAGRPVTLHLAAVPRVAGSNLTVSIKE